MGSQLLEGDRSQPMVAVVGLGCVFPGALDVETFWTNVLEGRNSISTVPPERWDPEAFFSEDRAAEDRTYCQVGGFIRDWQFDGRAFRVPPATARVMDRAQQYTLVAARQAFAQAGYDRKPFDRARTAVILGIAGGRLENEERTIQRIQLPALERALARRLDEQGLSAERRARLLDAFREEYLRGLLEITEDTFAGLCPNVAAGRIANFFDLHGPSYVVDAACASSLAAVDCAVDGLRRGDFDLAVCGGIHSFMGLSLFIGFSKFHGLSASKVSPFDEEADGFLLGEGAGLFLLKRLGDAQQDGDRVLAVIRGVGSSSDGREKGIGAPNPKAQSLAMQRAMDAAGYSPGTVQLIETHGAGTAVGDPAELEATHEVFGPHLAPGQKIAISAVKSQVGHLMGAAGAAGLMKTILGLLHRVLPPTINHTHPSRAIPWATLPFEVVTAPRPWPQNRDGLPRRANVSAFGFGGNNFHLALEEFDADWHGRHAAGPAPQPRREPIAIVGLGAFLPQAPDVEAFWKNVLDQVSAIVEVPPDRWDGRADLYVDANPDAADKSHSRLGAFADTPELEARKFRISPATLSRIDPSQKQLLYSAMRAFEGTRVLASPEQRRRTAVIVGDTGGCRELVWSLLARFSARHAQWGLHRIAQRDRAPLTPAEAETIGGDLLRQMTGNRPPITEDSIVGIATSTGPGRIAKSMDLMGTHMVVDAACGSSLAATAIAVRGLQSGKWDAVVTGGVAGGLTPILAVVASKAKALSATGSRPFDDRADGFVAGEGAVLFVYKRLGDAMAQGDRILGVIRGVGASSDGRGRSMYAPDSAMQALALSRAYEDSGFAPDTVQYVECHATATPVGDPAELDTLRQVFTGHAPGSLGIGSVKAQIGHTMSAAGAAGLLKTVLGLEHKTLPPMPVVSRRLAALDDGGPFHLVTRPEPWPAPPNGEPRRAGVSSFGFGGTNWHITVEEYLPHYHAALLASIASSPPAAVAVTPGGSVPEPVGLVLAAGASSQELLSSVAGLRFQAARRQGAGPWRLAFVARSRDDFDRKIDLIGKHYSPGRRSPILDAQGIYATEGSAGSEGGPLAVLFPGQGPQYADMLRDLADEHDVVRRTIAEANEVLREVLGQTFEQMLYTTHRAPEERATVEQCLLERSDIVQPALVTAGVALYRLLAEQGVRPATLAGHSLGEYTALVCAGVLDFAQALRAVHVRGQAFRDLASRSGDAGLMATVTAAADVVQSALRGVAGYVIVANRNCPLQTVISGEEGAVREAVGSLEAQGIECRILPIAGAFHSRIALAVRGRLEQAIAALDVRPPSARVLSSVDSNYYEPGAKCAVRVRANLAEQLVTPVDFIGLVERLYADGVRVFVEAGPKNALSGFVGDILGPARPHRALFANHPKIGETSQFDRFVAQFALLGPDGLPEPPETPGRAAGGDFRPAVTQRPPALAVPVGVGQAAAPAVPDQARVTQATAVAGRPVVTTAGGSAERIWITGVSIGLPGKGSRVFSDERLDQLLAGTCFIEPIDEALQDRIVAKRITRLVKTEDGEPYLAEVKNREDVPKLAGQRGAFSLRDDYGLEEDWLLDTDIGYQLAVAAGLECLRDARIPLQRAYKRTSTGGSLPSGWKLPESLQDDTAVIFASAYPGHNRLCAEFERYYAAKYGAMAAGALREQYLARLRSAQGEEERLEADQWFFDQRRSLRLDGSTGDYRFHRNFLADVLCMGNTRFAQLVRARGPNLAVNAAYCSTTAALASAEDLIRCGRARRVVVLAADDASSDVLLEWVGAGFLAMGVAATDREAADVALPFDRRRHGSVVGMGAVGFVVEAESGARERGLEPVADLLGVRMANSASHMTRPDVDHIVVEMATFLEEMEARHGIRRAELASKVVYVSHEGFTLPTGGIGAVEVQMLQRVFGESWRDVVVVNTKCMTGHAQGAGLEDAIILKALQAGKLPPVLHSTQFDPDLAGIRLSPGGTTDRRYALRFSAALGSQVAMSLAHVAAPGTPRVASESRYQQWLDEVTGVAGAELTVVRRVLQVREPGAEQPAAASATQQAAAAGTRTAPAATTPLGAAAATRPGASSAARAADASAIPSRVADAAAPPAVAATRPAPAPAAVPAAPAQSAAPPRRAEPAELGGGPGPRAAAVPQLAPIPAALPVTAPAAVTDRILSIIEEKTGYERQYLELDLDLEADLGIDTIKQAQVMARIREDFRLPKDQTIRVKDFPTLRHVVDYVQTRLAGSAPGVSDAVLESPAASQGPSVHPPPEPVRAVPQGPFGQPPPAEPVPAMPQGPPVRPPAPEPVAATVPQGLPVQPPPPEPVRAAPQGPPVQPPPPESVSAAPAGAPPAPAGDPVRQRVLDTVLGIIEQQTGYEREALEFDLDLEADLGIDTIKQAQVMARVREEFGLPREQGIRLKDFPTIRHVVDYVAGRVAALAEAAPAVAEARLEAAGQALPPPAPAAPSGVRRMALRWASHGLGQEAPNQRLGAGWTLLVTDDGLGAADALAQKLVSAGARVEIARDATDFEAARSRLGRVRGVILLHPLAADPAVAALDPAAWSRILERKVVASFRLLQALRGELELAVASTAMAGPFGWRGQLVDPGGAGVAGLLKALRQEAEAMLVKVVDLERPATRAEAEQVAETLLQEIEQGGRRVEVAYREGTRLVPRVVPEPLDLSVSPRLRLGPESVVVAFGGARGVTAAVVKELARRYRPRLCLVGTSTLPANAAELARLDAAGLQELKESIARAWKASATRSKPVEIVRRYEAALRAIETYRTIEACQAAGAGVSYHVCDVRSAKGVKDLVRSTLRRHGRIDGLIFGAGTIEDKLIEDKSDESFARVFGIKAEGIFNVYKALDGVTLAFLAGFSSVAGRFGNLGQSDYAAGNEVLARFVSLMQASRPETRCVTFAWTGWEEVGLAARSGVVELLKAQGLEALSPGEGARFFHEEILFGAEPEEVVIAGGAATLDKDAQIISAPVRGLPADAGPRLRACVLLDTVHGFARGAWLSATRTIDPQRDTWLRDHVIDGAPLVPAVFGIEMMAEAASLLVPGFHFSGLRDLKLHLAVKVLKDRPTVLKIAAVARAGASDDERLVGVRVTSDFAGPDGRILAADRLHYTANVRLRATPPAARAGGRDGLPAPFTVAPVPQLYGDKGTLPHGPTFRVIERVDGLDGQGAAAAVASLDESRVFPSLNGDRLLTLPFAREAAFQTAGIWGIVQRGSFGLPHGCRSLDHFGVPPPGTKLSVRVVPTAVHAVRIEYDIELLGNDGRLYDRMEGYYTVNPVAAAEAIALPAGSEADA